MTVSLEREFPHGAFAGARLPAPLRQAASLLALLILALSAATFVIDSNLPTPQLFYIASAFFHAQDAYWLAALALFLLGLAVLPMPAAPFERVARASPLLPAAALLLLALLVVALGALGAHRMLFDYPLSRDEFLARFDSLIFRSGQTVAPLPEEWRRYASALAWQSFMQPVADHTALVSAYLPVNAMLRALFGLWGGESLTSPLLAALAILSTYGVGRRLWPERRDAAFVAAVLVLTSSQVLVTAMTAYAMTPHLAFNLLWLWLFLRDGRFSHAGAIFIGFLASGLHQLVFHPLFAAPFVISLYREKRIRLALAYTLSYAAIGVFWVSYWKIGLALQNLATPGVAPQADAIGGARFFFERIASLIVAYQWHLVPLMLKNGLRFIVWQNPLLLPLAALCWRALAQNRRYAGELFGGVVLTLVAVCALMPFQGHGWGYRYLHGLIGNLALLAGCGWIAATNTASLREGAAMRAALFFSSAFSLLVLLTAHMESARAFTEPYARADAALRQSTSDVVLIDKIGMRYGIDFARNDPFLRERPLRLALEELDDADLAALCARYSAELFDVTSGAAYGVPLDEEELKALEASRKARRRPACAKPFPSGVGEKKIRARGRFNRSPRPSSSSYGGAPRSWRRARAQPHSITAPQLPQT